MNLYDLIDHAVGGITRDGKTIALVDAEGLVQFYMLTGVSGEVGKPNAYEDDWMNVDSHDPRPDDDINRERTISNKELRSILSRYLYPYYVVRHPRNSKPELYESGREGMFENEEAAVRFITDKYPHPLGGLRFDAQHIAETGGVEDWQYPGMRWSIVERAPARSLVYSD